MNEIPNSLGASRRQGFLSWGAKSTATPLPPIKANCMVAPIERPGLRRDVWRTRRRIILRLVCRVSRVNSVTPYIPTIVVILYYYKNENTLQLRDRRFRRNSYLQAVCDTPIARITGCVCPREGYRSATLLETTV